MSWRSPRGVRLRGIQLKPAKITRQGRGCKAKNVLVNYRWHASSQGVVKSQFFPCNVYSPVSQNWLIWVGNDTQWWTIFHSHFWFSMWISHSQCWWFGISDCDNTANKAITNWHYHSFLYKSNSCHISLQIFHSHSLFGARIFHSDTQARSQFWETAIAVGNVDETLRN